MANKIFILNDQSIKNSHGFRLLSSGGVWERFKNNPVMLLEHNSRDVIGRWDNLKIENGVITAEAVFDKQDPEAERIASKVERGFIKGASLGLKILKARWAEDDVYEVTQWEPVEASVVAVPSNSNACALKIYDQDHSIVEEKRLSQHIEEIVKLSINKKEKNMETIKLTPEALIALGLKPSELSQEALSEAVIKLLSEKKMVEKQLEEFKENQKAELKAQAKNLIELAVKKGKISADKIADFQQMAELNFEAVKSAIEAIPEKTMLAGNIKNLTGATELKFKTRLEYLKNEPEELKRLKTQEPELYDKLK